MKNISILWKDCKMTSELKKEIIQRTCAVCGKRISVRIYKKLIDKGCNYRGGHYFGKIPLYTKKELGKTLKTGTRKTHLGKLEVEVLKKDPKPYKYEEYWECPNCYWRYKK